MNDPLMSTITTVSTLEVEEADEKHNVTGDEEDGNDNSKSPDEKLRFLWLVAATFGLLLVHPEVVYAIVMTFVFLAILCVPPLYIASFCFGFLDESSKQWLRDRLPACCLIVTQVATQPINRVFKRMEQSYFDKLMDEEEATQARLERQISHHQHLEGKNYRHPCFKSKFLWCMVLLSGGAAVRGLLSFAYQDPPYPLLTVQSATFSHIHPHSPTFSHIHPPSNRPSSKIT